jgi:hypothetical protein
MQKAYRRVAQVVRGLTSTEREIASVKTDMDNKIQQLIASRETTLTLRAKVDQLRFENGQFVASGMSDCRAINVFARIQLLLCRIYRNGRLRS